MKGGGDMGHAPDADSKVRETLGETEKLDQSVVERSPLKCLGKSDDQTISVYSNLVEHSC